MIADQIRHRGCGSPPPRPRARRWSRLRIRSGAWLTLTSCLCLAGCHDTAGPPGAPPPPLELQEGNREPTVALVPKPSGNLPDNRLGAHLHPNGLWIEITYNQSIRDEILDRGVKRLHTSLFEIEPPIDWNASEHKIPPEYDRLIDEMAANGVVVDYLLHFWDKDGQGKALSTPRFQDQEQVDAFLEYVRLIVRHFRGRIQYYTIWSEPDYCGDGGIKCIEPQDYIELARQLIPVIREEDPQAKVGLAPVVLFFARDYLFTVLASDVAPMFDVIQWHGQYNVVPSDPFYGSYYYDYPAIVEQIKEIAFAHGFRGEYRSTEMKWCSEQEVEPPCGTFAQSTKLATDRLAAKYYARGIVMHLGMDIGAGVGGGIGEWRGPWSYRTRRYLNTVMAGATPASLPVTLQGAVSGARIQSFAFNLSNGDRLFALWNDGTAVEEDPGRRITLTFPDLSAGSVFGLDVLHGFEQRLIIDGTTGDLQIRDLLVRDYPLLLRLER